MAEKRMISLDRFAKGALREQVDKEMQNISGNIFNPNTSATAQRTITITLKIKPDEDRQIGNVEISTKSTLCPVKSLSTKMIFGYDSVNKRGHASELNAEMLGQVDLEEVQKMADENIEETTKKIIDLQAN